MNIILQQILYGLFSVYIFGIFPLLLFIVIIMGAVGLKYMKRDRSTPIQEFWNSKKNYKAKGIYYEGNHVSKPYLFVCIILVLISLAAGLNVVYAPYIERMLGKIEVISSNVLGLTTLVVTMAVVMIVLDKKYYLVFSIQEVLQKYHFFECLTVVLFSDFLVSAATMTLLDQRIESYFDLCRFMVLEVAAICNMAGVAYAFWIGVKVMFSGKKNELHLLDELYSIFWLNRVDMVNFREKEGWKKESIRINVEYLTERYMDSCRQKKIEEIEEIEFVTTIGQHKQKWYSAAGQKFIMIMSVVALISVVIDLLVLREQSLGMILMNFIVLASSVFLMRFGGESIRRAILCLVMDTWGYYLHKSNRKEIFIPRVALRKSDQYNKYIMRMNSLNAFFYIGIEFMEMEQEKLEEVLDDVVDWLETLNTPNILIYFPVFTIGYFLFSQNMQCKKIREVYQALEMDENKTCSLKNMLNGQIFYLTKNFRKEIFGYTEMLNTYIDWLEGAECP